MSDSPADILLKWFSTLAPELKDEVAALVSTAVPIALLRPEHQERQHLQSNEFEEHVREWCEGMPSRHFGTVIAVAAIVDAFMEDRGTPEDWEENERFFESVRNEPALKEFAESHLAELPLRSRRWIQIAGSWRALRNSSLSSSNIRRWMLAQR